MKTKAIFEVITSTPGRAYSAKPDARNWVRVKLPEYSGSKIEDALEFEESWVHEWKLDLLNLHSILNEGHSLSRFGSNRPARQTIRLLQAKYEISERIYGALTVVYLILR